MERLKKSYTLVELMVAMILLAGIILVSSAVITSFNKLYFDPNNEEANSLAAFNEIVSRLTAASGATVINGGSGIEIHTLTADGAGNITGDTTYRYWWFDNTVLSRLNPSGPIRTMARNIATLGFVARTDAGGTVIRNQFIVLMTLNLAAGSQKTFQTTITMRSSPA